LLVGRHGRSEALSLCLRRAIQTGGSRRIIPARCQVRNQLYRVDSPMPVVQFALYIETFPVARLRRLPVALIRGNRAEIGQRLGYSPFVSQAPADRKALFVIGPCLVMVSLIQLYGAQIVQIVRLPYARADLPIDLQRLQKPRSRRIIL